MGMRLTAVAFLMLGACALRPRYEELTTRFVAEDARRTEVLVQVLDRDDVPVPGARIEIGDRNRFRATTDADGMFRLPLEKKYTDENGLVVVVLPKGVRGYKFVSPTLKGQQMIPPLLPALPPAEGADGADAGVTTM